MLVTGHRCVLDIKVHLAEVQKMFSARKIIQVFYVVFFVVRTVCKFDYSFVIKDTTNRWRPLEQKSRCDKELGFDRTFFSPRTVSRVLMDSTEALQVSRILLGKRH